jgi:hypothetical protein
MEIFISHLKLFLTIQAEFLVPGYVLQDVDVNSNTSFL